MKPQLGLEMRPANTQEAQLICNCCGQPYYPNKIWEDCLRAVIFGADRFAICPLCTQSPPKDVLDDPRYRRPLPEGVVMTEQDELEIVKRCPHCGWKSHSRAD
jgi:hypothetical protein